MSPSNVPFTNVTYGASLTISVSEFSVLPCGDEKGNGGFKEWFAIHNCEPGDPGALGWGGMVFPGE